MIVLDASALVDVVTDRPARDAVLDHLDQSICAPGHQLAEVGSAIARLVRAGEISSEHGAAALASAAGLTQDVTPIDGDLLLGAYGLGASVRILDGIYVALAQRHRCPLLTTDRRLARANPPCEVICIDGDSPSGDGDAPGGPPA